MRKKAKFFNNFSTIFQRFLKISENRENIQFDTLKKMSTLRSSYMFDRLM